MRLLVILLLFSICCASSSIQLIDPSGDPVTISQEMRGRGCIAVNLTKDGDVEIIVQQDGSSDWAGIRALPTLAEVAITTLVGNRGPGSSSFVGPSDIQGCAGLFTVEEDEK